MWARCLLNSSFWKNQRFSTLHPKVDDFLLKTKTRMCNNGCQWHWSFNNSENHVISNARLAMVSWGLVCHKAGLISSIGVQCAPSVCSSQLLSYCCAQLGHFYLPCETNPEHLALISFSFKCITLSAGNGTMHTNWKVLKNLLYVF